MRGSSMYVWRGRGLREVVVVGCVGERRGCAQLRLAGVGWGKWGQEAAGVGKREEVEGDARRQRTLTCAGGKAILSRSLPATRRRRLRRGIVVHAARVGPPQRVLEELLGHCHHFFPEAPRCSLLHAVQPLTGMGSRSSQA